MFREMTRSKKQMSNEAIIPILHNAKSGVLAVMGENGYTYAVPLSFAYEEGKVYFHSLNEGHKVDAIIANPKVSFCIVNEEQVNQAGFTIIYSSVIIFGTARQLDGDEKRAALERIIRKYSAEYFEKGQKAVQAMWNKFTAFEVNIDHMTGKQTV